MRRVGIVIFIGSILAVAFGAGFSLQMNADGSMGSQCPFMEHGSSMCPLNIIEHLSDWKLIFSAILSPHILILLGVLGILVGAAIVLNSNRDSHRKRSKPISHGSHAQTYLPQSFLHFALYRGIVHPKLYL